MMEVISMYRRIYLKHQQVRKLIANLERFGDRYTYRFRGEFYRIVDANVGNPGHVSILVRTLL